MSKENIVKETEVLEEKISLSKEELDALIKKEVMADRQRTAIEEAKAQAKKAVEEEAERTRQASLTPTATMDILAKEKKYKVVIAPAEGEKTTKGCISINGVKFPFEYHKEVILPASAIEVLKNSKTYGKPKITIETDENGNKTTKTKPTFKTKRMFSTEAA